MKIIFLALFSSFILTEIVKWQNPIKKLIRRKPEKRLKPFDCFTCLSVWISVGLLWANKTFIDKAFIVTGTGVVAYIIGLTYTRWRTK